MWWGYKSKEMKPFCAREYQEVHNITWGKLGYKTWSNWNLALVSIVTDFFFFLGNRITVCTAMSIKATAWVEAAYTPTSFPWNWDDLLFKWKGPDSFSGSPAEHFSDVSWIFLHFCLFGLLSRSRGFSFTPTVSLIGIRNVEKVRRESMSNRGWSEGLGCPY